jgi:AcrR family transcriptional regulator
MNTMAELTNLQLAALDQFARHDFTGASMSAIADAAGIRKATIYSHFASKEELFLSLLSPVMQREHDFFEQTLADGKNPIGALLQYIKSYAERLHDSPLYTLFLLRAIYLPPEHLKNVTAKLSYQYYITLWKMIDRAIANLGVISSEVCNLSTAYLGILDSVQVSILYAEWHTEERTRNLWSLFEEAVARTAKQACL